MEDSQQPSNILSRILARIFALLPWGNQSVECVFCKIAAGNDPNAEILYHDSQFVVISDISPVAKHHYLVIPKEHIRDVRCLDDTHIEMVETMRKIGKQVLTSKGADWKECRNGFHWPPFISVSHLHLHIIAPESDLSTRGDLTFKPDSYWFKTTDYILQMLEIFRPPPTQIQSPVEEIVNLS